MYDVMCLDFFHRAIEVTVVQGDFQGPQAQLDLLELRYVKCSFPQALSGLYVWGIQN